MLLADFIITESRLGDFVVTGTNMPDADFWLVRRGSEQSVGGPTRDFNPEHIGIRVTAKHRIDSGYLYYVMQYLYNQGYWRDRNHGTLNLKNIRTQDVQNILVDIK